MKEPVVLLMEEILHQLIDTVKYYVIDAFHQVSYMSGGSGFLPFTVSETQRFTSIATFFFLVSLSPKQLYGFGSKTIHNPADPLLGALNTAYSAT